ncbi:FAD-dependent oxidoreductase [Maribacter sp. MMG018]|uniref:NAD(P)/FAD-dependent oxidoreductase n=1 Tax=Maribacter sp. MMG018 TaxID=2822688 RepID=UPI001B36C452|nr:FAD-dependent oxidoreductase [Maribacter sp. MMG018]MBQ4912903.1 FAD-dependent oxidoreductase [Maribacter sp. MMG018]
MLDYIVVGLGLAGTAFCEKLRKNNKTFVVFNDASQKSSLVAGGLSNPVILKRFTMAWKANELMPLAKKFYTGLGEELQVDLIRDQSVLRILSSIEEQNRWFEASDKNLLQDYLSPKLVRNSNDRIKAPYDFGEVLRAFRLDTGLMINSYAEFLSAQNKLRTETFEYSDLEEHSDYVSYKNIKAKHIVFAEGYGLVKNPFFNYLPMQGSKGEYLIIRSTGLKESRAVKSSIFIIPLGNDLYKVGATYSNKDKNNEPSVSAKDELLRKLDAILSEEYQVEGHVAGVRPTVRDRRPLVGTHPNYVRINLLNGFGSHGIMVAPWAAEELYRHIEERKPLDPELDINRFSAMLQEV